MRCVASLASMSASACAYGVAAEAVETEPLALHHVHLDPRSERTKVRTSYDEVLVIAVVARMSGRALTEGDGLARSRPSGGTSGFSRGFRRA